MEDGYILLHVLEVVVPGRDLGEGQSCEISIADATAQCPVPSTLQSENVSLPTGGAPEPVVHVRAIDSNGNPAGVVVVPVSSLVPMEVWNVWYAMDEAGDDVEEKSPEETPKMHLLLQCVPAKEASEETAQVREMRGQDFLLRALQQLNAALEAKVYEQQGLSQGSSPAIGYPPVVGNLAGGGPGSGPGGQQMLVPELPELSGLPGRPSSQQRALGTTAGAPAAPPLEFTPPAAPQHSALPAAAVSRGAAGAGREQQLQHQQAPRQGQPARRPGTSPGLAGTGPPSSAPPLPLANGTAAKEEETPVFDEEEMRRRLEPYRRAIEVLEEKQRFFDDQEARIHALSKALEDQQQRSNAMLSQHEENAQRSKREADAEREAARQAVSTRAGMQQRLNELEQEVLLRKAHEDSLQQRVSLMESELVVAHQKCMVAQTAEDEARRVLSELDGLKAQRHQLQRQMEEQSRDLSLIQEENWQLKEDRGREIEKARSISEREIFAKEGLQMELLQAQDALRDKEAEAKLKDERAEGLQRTVATLKAEATSLQSLLDRERQHRTELEAKLGELELAKLDSTLDEHRVLVRGLRTELDKARQELHAEKGRSNGFETDAAAAKKDLAKGQRELEEFRTQIVSQEELRKEIQSLKDRNEEVREQMRQVQQESRRVTDRFEKEIAEHLKAQKVASEARNEKLESASQIRSQLDTALKKNEELQLFLEQQARELESAREAARGTEAVAQQLYQAQQDLGDSLSARNQLHADVDRLSAKFEDDMQSRDQRYADLEASLEDRNNEIKLLMYRLQELSSRYVPVKGDSIDLVLSKWVNGYRPAVPFFRLGQGLYLFGRRQVTCKISNDKPVFRVGGGFVSFDKFVEQFASEELERLLTYDLDEKTGEPKFLEGLKVKQVMEESGMIEDLRQRQAEEAHQSRSRTAGGFQPLGRRSLNSSRGTL